MAGDDAMPRILLLGASSFLGRHLQRRLDPARDLGTHFSRPLPGTAFFDARSRALGGLVASRRFSHAVLMWAEARIDACKADPRRSALLNVEAPKAVIDELIGRGIKPVFVSTECVFDGRRGRYSEADEPCPNTLYGAQKLAVERHLRASGAEHVVLRLSKVYGEDAADGTLLTELRERLRAGGEARCATDQIFNPVHVEDAVEFIRRIIARDLSGVFHISGTETVSRFDLAVRLAAAMGVAARIVPCSIDDFGFLDHRPHDLSMPPDKAIAATGHRPRDLDERIRAVARG